MFITPTGHILMASVTYSTYENDLLLKKNKQTKKAILASENILNIVQYSYYKLLTLQ